MLRKLRIKFVCINMIIVTIMLVSVFSVLFVSTSRTLEAESKDMMRQIIEDPARGPAPAGPNIKVRRPYIFVRLGPDGEPSFTGGEYFDLSDSTQLTEIVRATEKFKRSSGTLPDYNLRFSRTSTPRGDWMVFVDTTNEQSALNNLMDNCIWIGIAAFMIFLGISIFLARWAVKPVDVAWQQQKQFIADASHELKTPLTVITTNAELLLEHGFTENEKEAFSSGILDMCRRMRGLVERLLDLARADDGSSKMDFRQVDFSETVTDAVLPFEPVFFERGMTFETDIEPGITVKGSAAHLGQLVEILLDNAQKYTSPQGKAVLRLGRTGSGKCLLTVSDTGDPISSADLKNIFKRFYRVDKTRSVQKSYGLGLSIAQSIADTHGGRIWAESKGGINTFSVELPVIHRG